MTTRVPQVNRGAPLRLEVNGTEVQGYPGETIAATLLAARVGLFHRSPTGAGRGPFCNMGACFQCLVHVRKSGAADSSRWVRACVTAVEPDMVIVTGQAFGCQPLGEGVAFE